MTQDELDAIPDAKVLRELLSYDPETGSLTWKPRASHWFSGSRSCKTWNTRFSGKEAFTATDTHGYRHGHLLGKMQLAHRVIWKLVHGEEPNQIDHIDGDRKNNVLSNLRNVTRQENAKNLTMPITNRSGRVGVFWNPRNDRWMAQIRVDGQSLNLGSFLHKQDAIHARQAAEEEHGFHPNHGRRQTALAGIKHGREQSQ